MQYETSRFDLKQNVVITYAIRKSLHSTTMLLTFLPLSLVLESAVLTSY